eukprot:403343018
MKQHQDVEYIQNQNSKNQRNDDFKELLRYPVFAQTSRNDPIRILSKKLYSNTHEPIQLKSNNQVLAQNIQEKFENKSLKKTEHQITMNNLNQIAQEEYYKTSKPQKVNHIQGDNVSKHQINQPFGNPPSQQLRRNIFNDKRHSEQHQHLKASEITNKNQMESLLIQTQTTRATMIDQNTPRRPQKQKYSSSTNQIQAMLENQGQRNRVNSNNEFPQNTPINKDQVSSQASRKSKASVLNQNQNKHNRYHEQHNDKKQNHKSSVNSVLQESTSYWSKIFGFFTPQVKNETSNHIPTKVEKKQFKFDQADINNYEKTQKTDSNQNQQNPKTFSDKQNKLLKLKFDKKMQNQQQEYSNFSGDFDSEDDCEPIVEICRDESMKIDELLNIIDNQSLGIPVEQLQNPQNIQLLKSLKISEIEPSASVLQQNLNSVAQPSKFKPKSIIKQSQIDTKNQIQYDDSDLNLHLTLDQDREDELEDKKRQIYNKMQYQQIFPQRQAPSIFHIREMFLSKFNKS